MKKKVKNLSELLTHLKKKNCLDDDALHVLSTVTAVDKEFISRQLATVTKLPLPQSYSGELRSFALTLNFYSPRAYEYVLERIRLCLANDFSRDAGTQAMALYQLPEIKRYHENLIFPASEY
ncbi:hypothetical protein AVEN_240490-1 [Araneus ventricosus]|uniref:THAP9-like helix-turn-helix domain-containing protein n=1 Tax=Araneus ventricosus TaxID=182803 RepID=A0A4Y2HLT2_ARAVE|nr:hypothetical protein AVEN_240490-1 [Araneus ventricosus]